MNTVQMAGKRFFVILIRWGAFFGTFFGELDLSGENMVQDVLRYSYLIVEIKLAVLR